MGKKYYYLPGEDALLAGQIIRTERVRRGLTQQQMGERMNLSTSYISSLERGKRRVSWHVGRQLYECFGISCDSILDAALAVRRAGVLREPAGSVDYPHKMDVLMRTCSDAEMRVCYSLCASYLRSTRGQSRPASHGTAREKEKEKDEPASKA